MSESKVAARYAQAVFEIGEETGQLGQLTEQLTRFAREFTGSKELRDVLLSPRVEEPARTSLIQALATRLQLGPMAVNTLRVLARRRRLSAVSAIADRLRTLSDERQGVVRVQVTSPRPLTETFMQRLVAQIETATGRKVVVERQLDPSLIAGVITKIGGHTVDGSLRGRLAQYGQSLTTPAN